MKKLICSLALAALAVGCCSVGCGEKKKCCRADEHISVFSSSIYRVKSQRNISLNEAAKLLRETGVTGFDCAYSEKNLPELAQTCLKPVNFFGWPKFLGADNGQKDSEEFVAQAVKYGVPRIMVVPDSFSEAANREAEFQRIVQGLKKLVKLANSKGIAVTVEDYGGVTNPCSYEKFLKRFLDEIPEIGYALDSGNLYFAGRGESILDMMNYAKGRIFHVHLKDQKFDCSRKYETLGLGGVPNKTIVKTMKANGYKGWYTLENMVGDDTLEDITRQVAVLRYWWYR